MPEKRRKPDILIVEDDPGQLKRYLELARDAGLEPRGAMTLDDALAILGAASFQYILTDVHLSSSRSLDSYEGIRILHFVKENLPEAFPLAMTADPKIETYHKVLAEGALYLFRKPIISSDELQIHLEAARSRRVSGAGKRTVEIQLPRRIQELCPDGVVLAGAIRETARMIAAHGHVPVVIYGETGTGKEEVARIIHRRRVEVEGPIPLIAVNCAYLNGETALSMLFGHKKGAFTGADQTTNGYIGDANGGILFLDEIHTLSVACQQRLLRVLNDGGYQRLGDTATLYSEFQVIAASTKDLDEEVDAGTFLLDLRSRLTGFDIPLSPLRDRKEDLPLLVALFFARQGADVASAEIQRIVDRCAEFYWRGNIRQLFQVLQVLLIQAQGNGDTVRAERLPIFQTMLPPGTTQAATAATVAGVAPATLQQANAAIVTDRPLAESMELFEKCVIQAAIARHDKIQDVARALDIARSTLDEKRKRHGL